MMRKVAIIGHFSFKKDLLNGQTVKTKLLYEALKTEYGDREITAFDTAGGKKAILRIPFQCFRALSGYKNIIVLPAHNGVRIIIPLLMKMNRLFGRKIHYVVIGGWLPKLVESKKHLKKQLLKCDCIYVETNTMLRKLNDMGFCNCKVLPNFKPLVPINEFSTKTEVPFKICTFSRVSRLKGIEDLAKAVSAINNEAKQKVYTIDVYGTVDEGEESWFDSLREQYSDCVTYKGFVNYSDTVSVVKDYFMLVFPTKSFTEGIPGTIIDAYFSAVPVLASRWESFDDVIDENVTGLGYAFNDENDLKTTLLKIAANPEIVINMKKDCLIKAGKYLPQNAIELLSLS